MKKSQIHNQNMKGGNMKKILLLAFLASILFLGLASAECQVPIQNATEVSGTVYIQGTHPSVNVSGADVFVTCNNGVVNITKTTRIVHPKKLTIAEMVELLDEHDTQGAIRPAFLKGKHYAV